jgi:hypothetical protein
MQRYIDMHALRDRHDWVKGAVKKEFGLGNKDLWARSCQGSVAMVIYTKVNNRFSQK